MAVMIDANHRLHALLYRYNGESSIESREMILGEMLCILIQEIRRLDNLRVEIQATESGDTPDGGAQ